MNYLNLLATNSRVKPKIIAYFATHESAKTVDCLASKINERPAIVGDFIREFCKRGFLKKTKQGYKLRHPSMRPIIKKLAEEIK